MSVSAANPSLISFENSLDSDDLNSTVLFTFLMGIYTMVYFGTLTLYLIKSVTQRRTVIFSITLLYLLDLATFGLQWYDLEWAFIINGETRGSIAASIFSSPGWVALLVSMTSCYLVVIADGLLIWRCFFVWNRSLHVIAVPCLLFFAEIVLCLTITIILGKQAGQVIPPQTDFLGVDMIQSALYFTSLASSLLATLLIAFKIHFVSKQNGRSKRHFGHVIEIVVQSAAVYSVALLMLGVANAFRGSSLAIVAFLNYGVAIAWSITGIAPTVMVARVCLAADTTTNVSTIPNLSGLQFQGRSTQQHSTQIMVENAPEMNVEVILPDKVTSVV